MTMSCFLIAVALASCAATAASAATIRGVVSAPAYRSAAATRPANGIAEAVVYLSEVPPKIEKKLEKQIAKKLAKKATNDTLVEKDHRFVPRVLPVAAGTVVRFENQDRIYHSVFSVSRAKRFDLGKHPPGETGEVVFDQTGAVQLYCGIDRAMAGFVFVTPNHLFVRPTPAGEFVFPKLPRGTYTVNVWHPRYGQRKQTVEIPKKGDAVVALSY
jgi:plastocyanin